MVERAQITKERVLHLAFGGERRHKWTPPDPDQPGNYEWNLRDIGKNLVKMMAQGADGYAPDSSYGRALAAGLTSQERVRA